MRAQARLPSATWRVCEKVAQNVAQPIFVINNV
jgi:hypothetical protein